MDLEIGKVTAATALRDELEETLASLTGLSVRAVRRKLNAVNGNTHARNALADAWPWDAERLGRIRVAVARDQGLVDELVYVTGLSARAVRRRLGSSNGRMLLQNAFYDHWPVSDLTGDEAYPDEHDGELIDEEVPDEPPSIETVRDRASRSRRADGEQIAGRYTVGKRIGRGGFGEVFEAWDELTGRQVVLKFANDDDIESLKHEFGKVFDLTHPHICAVNLQQDQLTGRGFLVMQHGGRSVADIVRREGPLDVERAIAIVKAVAGALDFAHDRKVIHYDVSPGNILVDDTGVVRLTDFGVAVAGTRRMTTRGGETLMAQTMVGYNPGYAAPEVYLRQARRSSDQFSLAHVFGSMIDGEIYPTPPPFRRRRALSREQNRALEKATQLDPRQRFASCRELADALAGVQPAPGSTSFLS